MPEKEENVQETDNLEENNCILDRVELSNNKEKENDKKLLKVKNNSNNSSNYNINKSKASTSDKSLIEENLKLKQQIIELKALNLQSQFNNNISNN